MRMPRVRFTIGRLMIVVAVAGAFSAWLRVPDAVPFTVAGMFMLDSPLFGLVYPYRFAKPGRRLLAATWVAALCPITVPWSLHVAWAVSYGYLGHVPGPADHGAVINVLGASVFFFMMISMASTILWLFFAAFVIKYRVEDGYSPCDTLIPIALMPVVWFSVGLICGLDPIKAANWFID